MVEEKTDPAAEKAARLKDADAILSANNYDQARLIPILQQIQERYKWLSTELLAHVAHSVGLAPARVYGVATFYAHFSLTPKGKHVIRLCDGTACHVKGSTQILDALREKLNLKDGAMNTDDMMFTVETVSCLGACGLAPVMVVDESVHGQVKPGDVAGIVDGILANEKENKQ